MMQPSNTPPDGDFAAYVERLTAGKAAPGAQKNQLAPTKEGGPADASFAASSAQPAAKAGLETLTQIPFLRHVKWVVALWIATQALARFVPGTGFLFIPVLVLYTAWVVFSVRRKPPGAFLQELRGLARRAAEEVRKAQINKSKNKS
ncbi:hypothetical protein BH10PSE16_BH10PSE16_43630 [soil metagenome]